MIRLNATEYAKAEEPLQKVKINKLFAQAVIRGHVPGEVYADDSRNPAAFYVVHPYGMSLLFGERERPAFSRELNEYIVNANQARKKTEWLQVYPPAWSALIVKGNNPRDAGQDGTGERTRNGHDKIAEFTRVNFRFDRVRYENAIKDRGVSRYEITPTTPEIFRKLEGVVTPKRFWRDAEQFTERGTGYTLMDDGEAASTAFASFVEDGQLEIGIETKDQFRGKGYAFHACAALIDYCLENGLEPVWSCKKDNEGSYYLAQSLGFVPTICVPYYRLDV